MHNETILWLRHDYVINSYHYSFAFPFSLPERVLDESYCKGKPGRCRYRVTTKKGNFQTQKFFSPIFIRCYSFIEDSSIKMKQDFTNISFFGNFPPISLFRYLMAVFGASDAICSFLLGKLADTKNGKKIVW